MSKYSAEFKLEIVQAFLDDGISARALALKHSLAYSKIKLWASLYRVHGIEGLTKKYSAYDAKFKLSVLRHMWAKKLSGLETAAIFNIRDPGCLSQWERLYREGGVAALKPRKQGRPKNVKEPKGKPPPGKPDAERSQKELIAELQQLRMENAYLKKLDALVRARRAPKGRK